MYKMIGADGVVYGPVSLAQIHEWITEGRINLETPLQTEGASGWRPAKEILEIRAFFSPPPVPPDTSPGAWTAPPVMLEGTGREVTALRTDLAITSFVLGILSFLCLGILAGIPAIITGHIAHQRARRMPSQYGGAGFAIAGFGLGYAGLVMTLIVAALLLPALATARSRAQTAQCASNMRQISVALRLWATDHDDQFPFNVSTNSGGTMEFADPDDEGFDVDPENHFKVLGKRLSSAKTLVCPSDRGRVPAPDLDSLGADNISYRLRVGPEVTPADPGEIVMFCPIHRQALRCDGAVELRRRGLRKVELR